MSRSVYYNEFEPYCAQWLRNLANAELIPDGDIDERSIEDVQASDLNGYTQCHLFAGIAGWLLALQLAGWPSDAPVWTGSCPCQPFSNAGKRQGVADARHLWPVWRRLIAECRPPVIFGEQIASKAGREWLAAVRLDLEALGYAVGAVDLCAASVGAPHIRQRLFFVAHPSGARLEERQGQSAWQECTAVERSDAVSGLDVSNSKRSSAGSKTASSSRYRHSVIPTNWDDLEWLSCIDGKARPTKPGIFPLAHGVSARVGKLRAYGNAIVPQVAAQFIASAMDCLR